MVVGLGVDEFGVGHVWAMRAVRASGVELVGIDGLFMCVTGDVYSRLRREDDPLDVRHRGFALNVSNGRFWKGVWPRR